MTYLSLPSYEYDHLEEMKDLLDHFIKEIPTLYYDETVGINIHQLSHIIECDIKLWGPLWTHNSFIYESMNGVFTSLIHGTQKVPKTAISNLIQIQNDPFQQFDIEFKDSHAASLYESLQENQYKYCSFLFFIIKL